MPLFVRRCAVAAFAFSTATAAGAQERPPIARFVPQAPDPAHVFVLDSAHILSAEAIAALQDSSRALQSETHADVAWVTLPTLGGRPIEEAALYIGRTWRIGSAGQPGDPLRNRGLVILFVPDKRTTAGANFRVEVGNGLEGTITDSRSRAISAAMREGLRAKRYDAAYLAGWSVAAALVREDYASQGVAVEASPTDLPPAHSTGPDAGLVVSLMFIAIAIVAVILIAASRRRAPGDALAAAALAGSDDDDTRRRGDWSSSFDSGSSSSSSSSPSSDGGSFGGGGGFSGGGSSDTI